MDHQLVLVLGESEEEYLIISDGTLTYTLIHDVTCSVVTCRYIILNDVDIVTWHHTGHMWLRSVPESHMSHVQFFIYTGQSFSGVTLST